jgi:hypothetical protein
MIVTDEADGWRLITQPDHARFSGELLRLWRGAELSAHPRREAIVFAGREHDNGWRETDAAPSWNHEAGRPHDFLSLPQAPRIEVWLRGTARFAEQHPYASLLVCLHALNFHQRRGDEAWDRMIDLLEERRDGLLAATGSDLGSARADYRFVRLADAASLAVCAANSAPFEHPLPQVGGTRETPTITGRFDPATATLHLAPLPLAGATSFEIPMRQLPRRSHSGDADLGGALAAERWTRLTVRVTG